MHFKIFLVITKWLAFDSKTNINKRIGSREYPIQSTISSHDLSSHILCLSNIKLKGLCHGSLGASKKFLIDHKLIMAKMVMLNSLTSTIIVHDKNESEEYK